MFKKKKLNGYILANSIVFEIEKKGYVPQEIRLSSLIKLLLDALNMELKYHPTQPTKSGFHTIEKKAKKSGQE